MAETAEQPEKAPLENGTVDEKLKQRCKGFTVRQRRAQDVFV